MHQIFALSLCEAKKIIEGDPNSNSVAVTLVLQGFQSLAQLTIPLNVCFLGSGSYATNGHSIEIIPPDDWCNLFILRK